MRGLKLKQLVKDWLPPAILSLCCRWRKEGASYRGDYATWQEALANSTGYDSDIILENVSSALVKVKSGEAVYERDSVLFNKVEHSFPLLAGLLRVATENEGKLSILDFGGSLGSTYFQCRDFLSVLSLLNWCIVEQEKFVWRGRDLFESEQLRFFLSIQECIKETKPHVILFSSVLQYIQNPYALLKEAADSEVEYIIIDRTPFSGADKDRICIQQVPSEIYSAKLPCRIFSSKLFKEALSANFNLIADFESNDQICEIGFIFMGSIWKRRVLL